MGTAPARPAQRPQGCSASDTSLMSIFLFINQQAINLLLSNSGLLHYLVSRCNRLKRVHLISFFLFVCSPSCASAPPPAQPGAGGPAALEEKGHLETPRDGNHSELPAMAQARQESCRPWRRAESLPWVWPCRGVAAGGGSGSANWVADPAPRAAAVALMTPAGAATLGNKLGICSFSTPTGCTGRTGRRKAEASPWEWEQGPWTSRAGGSCRSTWLLMKAQAPKILPSCASCSAGCFGLQKVQRGVAGIQHSCGLLLISGLDRLEKLLIRTGAVGGFLHSPPQPRSTGCCCRCLGSPGLGPSPALGSSPALGPFCLPTSLEAEGNWSFGCKGRAASSFSSCCYMYSPLTLSSFRENRRYFPISAPPQCPLERLAGSHLLLVSLPPVFSPNWAGPCCVGPSLGQLCTHSPSHEEGPQAEHCCSALLLRSPALGIACLRRKKLCFCSFNDIFPSA